MNKETASPSVSCEKATDKGKTRGWRWNEPDCTSAKRRDGHLTASQSAVFGVFMACARESARSFVFLHHILNQISCEKKMRVVE